MPVKESLIPPSTPLWAKLVVLKPKKSPVVDSRRTFSWAAVALRGGGGLRNGARTESHVGIPTGFLTTLGQEIQSSTDSEFGSFRGEVQSINHIFRGVHHTLLVYRGDNFFFILVQLICSHCFLCGSQGVPSRTGSPKVLGIYSLALTLVFNYWHS